MSTRLTVLPFMNSSPRCPLCAARNICLVGRLPAPSQDLLTSAVREITFVKGDVLLRQGVVSPSIRTVKLGTLLASRNGPDGVQRPVALLGRGHALGQHGVFGHETQMDMVALTPGRLCELRMADLRRLQVLDMGFLQALHAIMVHTFGRLADWGQVMRMRGQQRQLLAALRLLADEQGNGMVRLPSQQTLAELLSTSRESVARNLRQLEEDGVLRRIDRRHCELIEPLQATRVA
ncbi:Crp/Fnr family transcriptional regulator [Hydrogenophaga electricum]|uniref:Crp/Fnr family transcriptional regulator n=1 Tax=Hydrogenophaga electricum TaxID=1230953 RepID=A0ABQ6C1T0_9BURK|nr:Crp/Fnr family transcriptional regulator [Hydrogenophaga electricum]GLS12670.1 hypothetical protein GCM10007935_00960 [Hydrogenophaga electricum]